MDGLSAELHWTLYGMFSWEFSEISPPSSWLLCSLFQVETALSGAASDQLLLSGTPFSLCQHGWSLKESVLYIFNLIKEAAIEFEGHWLDRKLYAFFFVLLSSLSVSLSLPPSFPSFLPTTKMSQMSLFQFLIYTTYSNIFLLKATLLRFKQELLTERTHAETYHQFLCLYFLEDKNLNIM